jgi:hypothetical protein
MTKQQTELQAEIKAQKARYSILNKDIAAELSVSLKTANKYVEDVSKMPMELFCKMSRYLRLNAEIVTNYIIGREQK